MDITGPHHVSFNIYLYVQSVPGHTLGSENGAKFVDNLKTRPKPTFIERKMLFRTISEILSFRL